MSPRFRIGLAGFVVAALCAMTVTASTHAATTACRFPARERRLAHHDHVLVWTQRSVPGGSWGYILACSPSHPVAVAVVSVHNPICPSPTGCTDWDRWNYTRVRIAGSWVVASAAFTGSADWVELWNSRAGELPRRVAFLPGGPAAIDTYAVALGFDGTLAFAYEDINDKFRYFDALDACGSGCHRVRRVDTVLFPPRSRGQRHVITDIHVGTGGRLFWRHAGRPRETDLG